MKTIEVCTCDVQTKYECGGMCMSHCDHVQTKHCVEVALCAGRHDIPQAKDGYIFSEVVDVTDPLKLEAVAIRRIRELRCGYIDIYVTGLSVALIAALNAARRLDVSVVLYHYNRETGEYFSQGVI